MSNGLALPDTETTGLPDAVDLAALLHDNSFSWDDANAVNAVLTHHELVVKKGWAPTPTEVAARVVVHAYRCGKALDRCSTCGPLYARVTDEQGGLDIAIADLEASFCAATEPPE